MVEYNKAYKGSTNIAYIKKGAIVHKIYKGSTLVYKLGFAPVTFNVSSSLQTFTVPLGVSKIHVDCVASKGQDISASYISKGGKGGRVQCDLAVNGGETLYIMVGAIPTSGATASYNASDIRLGGNTLSDRIIVAGGGGGASYGQVYGYIGQAVGGDGGGTTGGTGGNSGIPNGGSASGGTQSAGGTGAYGSFFVTARGGNGELGLGGVGDTHTGQACSGGAGYYGGGGGCSLSFASEDGGAGWACGGAGGSSYTNSDCSNVVHTQGYNDGAGYITISFVS